MKWDFKMVVLIVEWSYFRGWSLNRVLLYTCITRLYMFIAI